jgi:16S rRNA processing protein RimM
MDIASCFKIGIVARPHGLKGEVTALFDEPSTLVSGDAVFLAFQHGLVPYFVERISENGRKVFIKFEDINTADEATALLQKAVYLPRSARPVLPDGQFYDDEIIGYDVVDKQEGNMGQVRAVVSAGPNKMLELEYKGREVLIPLNGPFITRVVPDTRTIHVDLPDGFLTL